MFRRDLKLFFKSLISASVLCAVLASVCALAAVTMLRASDSEDNGAKVAIVVNEDSLVGRILINTVEEVYLSNLLNAERTDEITAIYGVKSGEYAAAVIIPDGFFDDITEGKACEGQILLSSGARSQAEIIESIVSFGKHLLMAGQYGVFAGERLIGKYALGSAVHAAFLDEANPVLLDEALDFNTKYFKVDTVDYSPSGMPVKTHFVFCWLLFLLFLLSLFFIPLFLSDCTRGVLSRLSSYGIGSFGFMKGKLLLMTAFRLAVLTVAAVFLYGSGMIFPGIGAFICAVAAVAFITLICAALTMCFGDGLSANIIVGIAGMLLCGGIAPRAVLPQAALTVGRFTPFGAAKALLEPLFGVSPDVAAIAAATVYAVIAVILIRGKLMKTMLGGNDK